jgi:outer membrane receptor for ferrienterochelin and colicin
VESSGRCTSEHRRAVLGLFRSLPGAALVLCVLSTTAFAQDSAQSEIDLGALLDTPVSTAAKYAQNVRQVAGSVTIVTAEDIRRFGYRTLTDVLQSMAGVYVSNQRSMESFGIRGFGPPTD